MSRDFVKECNDIIGCNRRIKELTDENERLTKKIPYDAYWSKRALAAEKLLRASAEAIDDGAVDWCATGKIDGAECFAKLCLHSMYVTKHFKKVDSETGVPKELKKHGLL